MFVVSDQKTFKSVESETDPCDGGRGEGWMVMAYVCKKYDCSTLRRATFASFGFCEFDLESQGLKEPLAEQCPLLLVIS